MGRTLLCSLVGAVAGFLVGFAGIHITAGNPPKVDTPQVSVFVGIFFAGIGAIVGAIIGGVANLREFRRKDQAPRESQDRDR